MSIRLPSGTSIVRGLRRCVPSLLKENHPAHFAFWLLCVSCVVLVALGIFIHLTVSGILALRGKEFAGDPQSILRRYGVLLQDLRETERERALLPEIRPVRENLLSVVEMLESFARLSAVEQTVMAQTTEQGQEVPSYGTPVVRYSVKLQGSLDAVIAYLRLLQSAPRLVRIERLAITGKGENRVLSDATEALLQIVIAVRDGGSP